MSPVSPSSCTAFDGVTRVTSGTLAAIAPALKALTERQPDAQILIFDDLTGKQLDLNLHGSLEDVMARLARLPLPRPADGAAAEARAPGRPKLGVVGREVTLLPRHWTWLNEQPGGASVALRKLVEHALRDSQPADRQRAARDGAYQFMSALAGDQPGFEEATRALFAGNQQGFSDCIAAWPADVRAHASAMARDSFA